MELVEDDGRIGAEREERGGAEIHVAAIAAEDVPGGRQHDVLQHDIAGEEQIFVAEGDGPDIERRADGEPDDEKDVRAHGQRPIRPAGRNASVSNKNPNDTAGAQDGP